MPTVQFIDLGLLEFREALRRQEEAVSGIAAGDREETVHLLEHPHVWTLGRSGRSQNLHYWKRGAPSPAELVCINRGGDITYHGPGQLVVYPHLDLRRRGRDVHLFLRNLEECLIQTVSQLGVAAYRRPGLTGVWTDRGKLASVGVGVRRWVTMHGLALNVNTDLRFFDLINPCGLENCPVTSLAVLLQETVALPCVKGIFEPVFRDIFRPPRPPGPEGPRIGRDAYSPEEEPERPGVGESESRRSRSYTIPSRL